ncbi:MAG: metal dependent phosphohydrolase, partial [Chthoniobacteraceae bacterium]|nr:metal dependent phosphohydrolase [Chthoniobacteraceae bacterium]
MVQHSISTLKRLVLDGRLEACVHGQIETLTRKETREGKPFFEMTLSDAEGRMVLRAWNDGPAFALCEGLSTGAFIEVCGEFTHGAAYGLESRRWHCRELQAGERESLLGGPSELREKQAADFACIMAAAGSIGDPRLQALTRLFFQEYGERFRRAAAARTVHHARRGGLVEHVAQMVRAAEAIAVVYPMLNRDLLVTGVLFHDAVKLWENEIPAD